MELRGGWRAADAHGALRRRFADPGLDDSSWEDVPVPGHWRSVPAFAASDGPLLYRRRFHSRGDRGQVDGRRWWLTLEGAFYQTDVWLDGSYLGDSEGYFVPHTFEVTDLVRSASEHVLAVEVACPPQPDSSAKRNLTGVLQHSDVVDPSWNPGGLWRPVRMEPTGAVRIRSLRVLCPEATPERAVVAVRADLDSDRPRRVRLRTTVAGVDDETDRQLAQGPNWVEWRVTVPNPSLWWPRALGPAPLHDVAVAVLLVDEGGVESHRRSRRLGLRAVTWRRWVLSVNGERLFLKGANVAPTRMALADAPPEEVAGDVRLAVDAGLDLLRVRGHVSRPELYDAADRAGVLLWQDLPLHGGYARGVRRQAVRQAWAATEVLGHHPSIALWCAHNHPFRHDGGPGPPPGAGSMPRRAGRWARLVLPTWTKDVLDRSVQRALERADGSRPAVRHSGAGSDSHLALGWCEGDEADLGPLLARLPRLARFVSEFGAQAVPSTAAFMDPGRWPHLDWEDLAHRHHLQRPCLERRAPVADHATFESWRQATQRAQAQLIRRYAEHLRRLKYRPAGGFAQLFLADAHPGVTSSVLDHERGAKAGYAALAAACAPLIVAADPLPAALAPGQAVHLDVHVVSDLRHPVAQAEVTAGLGWPGGGHRWRWQGTVPADSCVRVGAVRFVTPPVVGLLGLDLELTASGYDRPVTNRYESVVRPGTGG